MNVLRDKVVVVTGGAGLLGRQFCRAVAEAGAVVVVADRDVKAASQVAEDLIGCGLRAVAAVLDITSRESVDALIASLLAEHERLDAVVNNAYPRNARYGRKVEDVTYDDFCENLSLNAGGYFQVAQRFALAFRERGGGSIVNIASIYGVIAPRFEVYDGTPMTMPVEYAAIKSAVLHLTRYFAQYFKADGVRVDAISPGGIRDRQPEAFLQAYRSHCGTKGMLDPQDIAGSLVFLLSDASRFVTGQNIIADDGFSL